MIDGPHDSIRNQQDDGTHEYTETAAKPMITPSGTTPDEATDRPASTILLDTPINIEAFCETNHNGHQNHQHQL
jgi:hypothetical protein